MGHISANILCTYICIYKYLTNSFLLFIDNDNFSFSRLPYWILIFFVKIRYMCGGPGKATTSRDLS